MLLWKDSKNEIFENLYKYVNGYNISHQARDKMDKEIVNHLIYGELSLKILRKLYNNKRIKDKINNSKVFYDLGSGTGKIILASTILLPTLEKFIGIELLKELYDASNSVKENFAKLDEYNYNKIKFINDNFFNINIQEADIIFLHFPIKNGEDLYLELEKKFVNELKKGSVIISAIRKLEDTKNFIIFDKIKVKSSYGKALLFCYYRI